MLVKGRKEKRVRKYGVYIQCCVRLRVFQVEVVSRELEAGCSLSCVPLSRSIQELTLIFSLDFINFKASSRRTSPVRVSSITSIIRSGRGNRRLEGSFCMLTRPRKASSMTMHPLRAYEMLSFQKERYPCKKKVTSVIAVAIALHVPCVLLRTRPLSQDVCVPAYLSIQVVTPPPSASTWAACSAQRSR